MNFSHIQVSGVDAAIFLQGQITADIFALKPPPEDNNLNTDINHGLAAICNLQGRVITLMWISQIDQLFILTLPENLAAVLITHLKRFVFRSKVVFTLLDNNAVDNSVENKANIDIAAIIYKLPPFPVIPWITTETTELFLPQALNLDCLNAINFKKGCYTGQEVIARLHYLGKNKRRMILCELTHANTAVELDLNIPIISITAQESAESSGESSAVGQIVLFEKQPDKAYMILISLQLNHLHKPLFYDKYPLKILDLPYLVPELINI